MLIEKKRMLKKLRNDYVGLIDADFLKYLIVYDIEKMYKKGLNPKIDIEYDTLVKLIHNRMDQIYRGTQKYTKEYIFIFSGKTRDNHRALIACEKKYKGTRKYVPKVNNEADYKQQIEEYIADNYNFWKEDDLEADDLCVMAHTKDTYIYSYDKDLRTSPGLHFDIKANKFFEVTASEGFRTLLIQSMTGDSVDNIAGLEGVGPVSAKRIAANKDGILLVHTVIKEFMTKHGLRDGLDRFVEMYSLVSMRTSRGAWIQEKYKGFFSKIKELVDRKGDEELEWFK